jgi:hypothetical protein
MMYLNGKDILWDSAYYSSTKQVVQAIFLEGIIPVILLTMVLGGNTDLLYRCHIRNPRC